MQGAQQAHELEAYLAEKGVKVIFKNLLKVVFLCGRNARILMHGFWADNLYSQT